MENIRSDTNDKVQSLIEFITEIDSILQVEHEKRKREYNALLQVVEYAAIAEKRRIRPKQQTVHDLDEFLQVQGEPPLQLVSLHGHDDKAASQENGIAETVTNKQEQEPTESEFQAAISSAVSKLRGSATTDKSLQKLETALLALVDTITVDQQPHLHSLVRKPKKAIDSYQKDAWITRQLNVINDILCEKMRNVIIDTGSTPCVSQKNQKLDASAASAASVGATDSALAANTPKYI